MNDECQTKEEKLTVKACELADLIAGVLPPELGFTLFLFELNVVPAAVVHVSSAEIEGMITTLKAWLNGRETSAP